MIIEIEDKTLIEKLNDLGVVLLVKFGSFDTDLARENSDLDIGVLFDFKKYHPRTYGTVYGLLQELFPGQLIDLVSLNEAPYTLQYRVAMEGEPLFQLLPTTFADFKERAMLIYFDFLSILKIHQEAIGI